LCIFGDENADDIRDSFTVFTCSWSLRGRRVGSQATEHSRERQSWLCLRVDNALLLEVNLL
jgi:hypothetical protein